MPTLDEKIVELEKDIAEYRSEYWYYDTTNKRRDQLGEWIKTSRETLNRYLDQRQALVQQHRGKYNGPCPKVESKI